MVRAPGKKIAVTEEDKAGQRQKIIAAALKVFGKQGYHSSTISQIAKEADMGRGTLYWYFKSKEELFRELIRQFMDGAVAQVQEQVKAGENLESTLRTIIRSWLEAATLQPELFHIMYSIFGHSHGDISQEMIASMRVMYQGIMETLEGLFTQAIAKKEMRQADVHSLARLLVGLIDGIIIQHITIEPIDPEAMTEVVMRLLLKGLRPENEEATHNQGGEHNV
jgi:AcrR family transcriptional regulator